MLSKLKNLVCEMSCRQLIANILVVEVPFSKRKTGLVVNNLYLPMTIRSDCVFVPCACGNH